MVWASLFAHATTSARDHPLLDILRDILPLLVFIWEIYCTDGADIQALPALSTTYKMFDERI